MYDTHTHMSQKILASIYVSKRSYIANFAKFNGVLTFLVLQYCVI